MSHFQAFHEGARIEPRLLRATAISQAEVRFYLARGRRLQGLAILASAARAFRALRRALRWVTALVLAPGAGDPVPGFGSKGSLSA